MNKRKAIISIVLSVIFILLGSLVFQSWSSKKKSTVSDDPIKEKVALVTTGRFDAKDTKTQINLDGRLVAYEKIDIAAEASGRLISTGTSWNKGSYFKKGDLLFQLDQQDQKLSLYAQRSSLLNAVTQIMPNLKFDYPTAFQKWKSYLDDFDIERTTKKFPEIGSPEEKYFIAGKNLYNLYYSIKSAEDRMQDYNIYAPFSGVFLSISAFPGALASPGVALARIMNTSKYELETPVSMSDYDLIKRGQTVNLKSDDTGASYTGTISRVSSQIDQMTQSIPVFVRVSGRGLKDGMYLKGALNGSVINDVFELPKSAVINQNTIYVIQDSIITEKQVKVVQRGENEVFIQGVSPSDEIITRGLNSLSPGQKAVGEKS